MDNIKPLVTVGVITYNSSNTIIDTLESIKAQTYNNLELVVSDDGSIDDTVDLCQKWLINNNSRFVRTIILTVKTNTGISANNNRCMKAAEGQFFKGIAGDDLLNGNCIDIFVQAAQLCPDINVFFSKLRPFTVDDGVRIVDQAVPSESKNDFYNRFNETNPHEQFRMLLTEGCFLQAPTCFWRTDFAKSHPFPEIYKYEDDYPMWLRLTRDGNKLLFLHEDTVYYRRGESLSSRKTDYYSKKYFQTRNLLFWNEFYDYAKQEGLAVAHNRYRKVLLKYEMTEAFTQNKKTKYNSIIVRIINFVVNKFAKYEF